MKQVRPPGATAPRIALAAGAVSLITVALVILIQFFMGWRATPVDMIGLHYTGGPIDGQQFVKIIEPGSGKPLPRPAGPAGSAAGDAAGLHRL